MRCDKVRERFPEFMAGALGGTDFRAVEEHLQNCPDCANELENLSQLDARLRQEVPRYWQSVKPTPAFLARLRGLDLESPPRRISVIAGAFSALWLRHRPALAVGLSVCLVVALAIAIPWIVSPRVAPVLAPVEEAAIPVLVPPPVVTQVAALDARQQPVSMAAQFLRDHFEPEVGLIRRGEGAGFVTVDQQQYRYHQIFWLYPDNLIASYALEPFDADMDQRIRETLHRHAQPPSQLFEVLFGEQIPQEIAAARQVVIAMEPEFVIIARFHDSPMPLSWQDYGDMLIYQSLNQHLRDNREAAKKYFLKAYSMWDGKGIYDAATRRENVYASHKLALILYASRVLDIPITNQIEARLWSMQNPDGGIAAYFNFEGDVLGLSCIKATAIALLLYNKDLIAQMR